MTHSSTTPAWDYSTLAYAYEERANYAPLAVEKILRLTHYSGQSHHVIDIGAGTGKLTRPLLCAGCRVIAVEPNAVMRAIAMSIGGNARAQWIGANAENLPVANNQFDLASFASSFNVVDAKAALHEASRVLKTSGVLAILWNHRDLTDPLQLAIEAEIRSVLPNFEYGSRRENPTQNVLATARFSFIEHFRCDFVHATHHERFMTGWRSHATLARAAGTSFDRVIERIAKIVPAHSFSVPFSTVVWLFQKTEHGQ
jgi:ubiquinone/menaquinone biosynthesis C-methylase UbiE